jgi:RNA polymerase sigma-70 factor (ECF subfamily)
VAADEHALFERARQGDSQAFGLIYQRYIDRVYSFVFFRVRDETLAEDLTQDVFLQALRGLGSVDWRGSLAPWLLRIARNTVIDHWRRVGRRPEQTLSELDSAGAAGSEAMDRVAVETSFDGTAHAERALDRDRILSAARHLTELQQQVLALRFSAGLTIRETADVMGRSEGAIKNLQHHALRALRKAIETERART